MTIAAQDSFSSTSNLTTYGFSGVELGAESADRVVYILIGARAAQTQAVSILSVTVAGIQATEVVQEFVGASSGANTLGIFAVELPTGVSASVNVTFNRQQFDAAGLFVLATERSRLRRKLAIPLR